jgi:hypothetical protein
MQCRLMVVEIFGELTQIIKDLLTEDSRREVRSVDKEIILECTTM